MEKCFYDYENKCDCSEDDKCGCTYPNNMSHNFSCENEYPQLADIQNNILHSKEITLSENNKTTTLPLENTTSQIYAERE